MLNGIRQARSRGYSVGIVTNGYFATSEENARCFLEPFPGLGLADLSISDDVFHYENREENAARRAFRVALEMGLPAAILALDPGASGAGDEGIPSGGEERSHHRRGHHVSGAGCSETEPVCQCQRLADIHDLSLRGPAGTVTAARGCLRQPPDMPGDLYREYLGTSARRTGPEL